MKCPVDGAELVMTERSGVEIDYCPQCRGVWLDRGELDKIIDRGAEPAARPAPRGEYRRGDDDDDDYYRKHGKKRREGFLGNLFDF